MAVGRAPRVRSAATSLDQTHATRSCPTETQLDVLLAEKDPLGHWVRYETDEGRPYYYNKVINESK